MPHLNACHPCNLAIVPPCHPVVVGWSTLPCICFFCFWTPLLYFFQCVPMHFFTQYFQFSSNIYLGLQTHACESNRQGVTSVCILAGCDWHPGQSRSRPPVELHPPFDAASPGLFVSKVQLASQDKEASLEPGRTRHKERCSFESSASGREMRRSWRPPYPCQRGPDLHFRPLLLLPALSVVAYCPFQRSSRAYAGRHPASASGSARGRGLEVRIARRASAEANNTKALLPAG